MKTRWNLLVKVIGCNRMVVFILLFSAFFIFTKNCASSKDVVLSCQTPDLRKGFCVSIFDCPELIKLVHETGQDGANFAKRSICLGCIDNDTWVCCTKPRNMIVPRISSTNATIPVTTESKESIKKQKQKNLEKLIHNSKYCGQQHSAYRVGKPGTVEIDEYPWIVQIKHGNDEPIEMRCNGVIIEKRYILTTSKCGFQAKTVLLGQFNTGESVHCTEKEDCTEPTKELSVDVVSHSNKAEYDIFGVTLLKVREAISYTDYVRPICLPLNRTEASATIPLLKFSGWMGVGGNKKEAEYRRAATVECIDQKQHEKLKDENISVMCLIPGYLAVPYCEFDFGGPLMFQEQYNKWYLDGFVSIGYPKDGSFCSISNVTGLYLTPNLMDFIVSNIN